MAAALAPALASASALNQTQVNAIMGLLQSFGADQTVLSNVQGALTGTAPSASATAAPTSVSSTGSGSPERDSHPTLPPPTASSAAPSSVASTPGGAPVTGTGGAFNCATIVNNLRKNATDETTNGEVSRLQQFLGGRVTGTFGPATEQLLKKWQAEKGIVSGGSAGTTGFGMVGARTRAAMACAKGVPFEGLVPPGQRASTTPGLPPMMPLPVKASTTPVQ